MLPRGGIGVGGGRPSSARPNSLRLESQATRPHSANIGRFARPYEHEKPKWAADQNNAPATSTYSGLPRPAQGSPARSGNAPSHFRSSGPSAGGYSIPGHSLPPASRPHTGLPLSRRPVTGGRPGSARARPGSAVSLAGRYSFMQSGAPSGASSEDDEEIDLDALDSIDADGPGRLPRRPPLSQLNIPPSQPPATAGMSSVVPSPKNAGAELSPQKRPQAAAPRPPHQQQQAKPHYVAPGPTLDHKFAATGDKWLRTEPAAGQPRKHNNGSGDQEFFVSSGLENGHGTLTNRAGDQFDGWLCEGQMTDGYGTLRLANGCVYRGQFQGGARHGTGAQVHPDGSAYEGQWRAGAQHGETGCNETEADGSKYVGGFHRGRRSGKGGCLKEAGGRTVCGEFELGRLKDGYSEERFEPRTSPFLSYDGQFVHQTRHGEGVLLYSSGDKYLGQFVNGLRSGEGRLTFSRSHDVFYGKFEQDRRVDGPGTMAYGNRDRYEGYFVSDEHHGHGVLQTMDCRYEGDFANGKRHGRGVCENSVSGDVYTGEWADDLYSGFGVFVYGVHDGEGGPGQQANKPTSSLSDTSAKRSQYDGEFKQGTRHGKGLLSTPLTVYDGEWFEDVKNGWATVTELASGLVFRTFWRKGQEERSSRRSLSDIGGGSHVSQSQRGSSSSSGGGSGGGSAGGSESGEGAAAGVGGGGGGGGGGLSARDASAKAASNKDLEYKIMSLFTEFSSKQAGIVNQEEFGVMVSTVLSVPLGPKDLRQTFSNVDSTKTGRLTLADVRRMLQAVDLGKGSWSLPDVIVAGKHAANTFREESANDTGGAGKQFGSGSSGSPPRGRAERERAAHADAQRAPSPLRVQQNGAPKVAKDGTRTITGTITYSNGDAYTGTLDEQQNHPDGTGTLRFGNGDVYTGDFAMGRRHGQGVLRYICGDVYQGAWGFGEQNGLGKMKFQDGCEYDGVWQGGCRKGRGTMSYLARSRSHPTKVKSVSASCWEGDRVIQQAEEDISIHYHDGSSYRGCYRQRDASFDNAIEPHGYGEYRYSDGGTYLGQFAEGVESGTGKFTREPALGGGSEAAAPEGGEGAGFVSLGEKYVGEWSLGVRHGEGHLIMPNGNVFDGKFVQGAICYGDCKLVYPDGTKYDGQWLDCRKGRGKFINANGDVHEGFFKDDNLHGKGRILFGGGREGEYEGELSAGVFEGTGTRTCKNGDALIGEWRQGKLNGLGLGIFGTGDRYLGEWRGGLQHGYGKRMFRRKADPALGGGGGGGGGGSLLFSKTEMPRIDSLPVSDWRHAKFDVPRDGIYELYCGQWEKGEQCGSGTMNYTNLNRYEGQWDDDKPHGRGDMSYADGAVYSGEWHHGKRKGVGMSKFDARCAHQSRCGAGVYEGEFAHDYEEGKGKFTYADGNTVEGFWKDGAPDLMGSKTPFDITYVNGDRYHGSGDWGQGLIRGRFTPTHMVCACGKGSMSYHLSTHYDGEWQAGVHQGFGTLKLGNGDVYTGQWLDGMQDGDGELVTVRGERLQGLWTKGDLVSGDEPATIKYSNGDVYTGALRDRCRHGPGSLEYANGRVYSGEWKCGRKMDGYGTMTFPEGAVYSGEWQMELRWGKGDFTMASGDHYVGEWLSGKMHGRGVYDFADGGRFEGRWEHNQRVDGDGAMHFPDHSVYRGQFQTDQPHGEGKWEKVAAASESQGEAASYEGQWKIGKRCGQGTGKMPGGMGAYSGFWEDDKRHGHGQFSGPKFGTYIGEWVCDERQGKGKHAKSDGEQYDGHWVADLWDGPGMLQQNNGVCFTGTFSKGLKVDGKLGQL